MEPQIPRPEPEPLPLGWRLAIAAIFLIVGPGICVGILFLANGAFSSGESVQMLPTAQIGDLFALGLACVLLSPFGLITGLIAGWMVGRVRWATWVRIAALTGGAVSGLATVLAVLVSATLKGEWTSPHGNPLLIAAGAGAACGALGAATAYVSAGAAWVLLMATRLSPDRPQPSPPA